MKPENVAEKNTRYSASSAASAARAAFLKPGEVFITNASYPDKVPYKVEPEFAPEALVQSYTTKGYRDVRIVEDAAFDASGRPVAGSVAIVGIRLQA